MTSPVIFHVRMVDHRQYQRWMPRHSRAAALIVFAVLLAASPALAQTGAGLLVRPFRENTDLEIEATAYRLFDGETDNGDADYQLTLYESRGRLREDRQRGIPRFGYELAHLSVAGDDPAIPERLTDVSAAVGLPVPGAYGFTGGISLGIGYAGDGPFGDPHAFYGKATLGLAKQLDEVTDLAVGLDYDGNRTFLPDVPLPGFAYRKKLDPTLVFAIGVPVTSLEWRPDDRLTVVFQYLLVDRFDVRVDYRVVGGLNVFASLDQRRLAFEMDELPEHDRLLFEQRRVEAGLRWEPREDAALIIAGGYAFGQEFSTGFDFRDNDKVAELSDEPYARVGLDMRF
jgi:hypothetical protein